MYVVSQTVSQVTFKNEAKRAEKKRKSKSIKYNVLHMADEIYDNLTFSFFIFFVID